MDEPIECYELSNRELRQRLFETLENLADVIEEMRERDLEMEESK
jgi:hypothetical protein